MENQYRSFVAKKLAGVKFISVSANEAQYRKSDFIGQIAYKFPKAGQTTIYVSMLTAELFMVTAHNGRMSHALKMSKDIKEISEAAIKAFEVACIAEKLDKKLAKEVALKAG